MPAEYRAYIESTARPRMHAIAKAHYGLDIHEGPFGIDSRKALIGSKYAEAQGKGQAYHNATFRAYWQQAQSIDDVNVLRRIAELIGLSGEAFVAALDNPMYEQQVLDDIAQAPAYGLSGVPALVFENRYLVSGAQPYEMLVKVVEQIRAQV